MEAGYRPTLYRLPEDNYLPFLQDQEGLGGPELLHPDHR